MLTRPSRAGTILAIAIASSLSSAHAQTSNRQITLADAREILGASPVAIPGYPVEIFRLHGRAILVRQRLDSTRVIAFREDRYGRPLPRARTTTQREEVARMRSGMPSSAEERSWARRAYREVGSVSVRYLGMTWGPIPHDLLDKLEPIP